jgi:gamma-glutamyl hercynylcysteine S-oxide synthase
MSSLTAARAGMTPADVVDDLTEARTRTLALVASISDADLERVHSTLMSPLVWDLGHIAAFEDLWLVHRYGDWPLLRDDLADVYDAFETPRAERGDLPFLAPGPALEYLEAVRERTLDVIDERGVGDGFLHEMVLRHEYQHNETMLQTIELARLRDYELAGSLPAPGGSHPVGSGLELVEIPGGECTIGALPTGFAYDNGR